MSVKLTPAQARAVAELADREGAVTLHQLAHSRRLPSPDDLYVTPHGAATGYRVTRDGEIGEIGETLPAED